MAMIYIIFVPGKFNTTISEQKIEHEHQLQRKSCTDCRHICFLASGFEHDHPSVDCQLLQHSYNIQVPSDVQLVAGQGTLKQTFLSTGKR